MPKPCPACGSEKYRVASLRAGDSLLHRFLFTALRCRDCRERYWTLSALKIGLYVLAFVLLLVWLIGGNLQHQPSLNGVAIDDGDQRFAALSTRAKNGDTDAELQLGKLYANGEGVIVNNREAARWFAKAAHGGNSEAQYWYAVALLDGRGVVQDYQAALKWIELPARRGNPDAQYRLGRMYQYGTGTPADKVKAYTWFNLAAAQGVDDAVKARDSVVWQLKPDEVAAAQTEAHKISDAMLKVPDGHAPATVAVQPALKSTPALSKPTSPPASP
jgi:hypothetical protein